MQFSLDAGKLNNSLGNPDGWRCLCDLYEKKVATSHISAQANYLTTQQTSSYEIEGIYESSQYKNWSVPMSGMYESILDDY